MNKNVSKEQMYPKNRKKSTKHWSCHEPWSKVRLLNFCEHKVYMYAHIVVTFKGEIMTEEKKMDNYLMRCWLESIEGIVGSNGLKSILNYAHLQKYIDNFPPDDGKIEVPCADAQLLFLSLYELFGQKGVRNLSLRTGKEFSRIGLKGRKNVARAMKTASLLLSEAKRIHLVLKICAAQTNKSFSHQKGEKICSVKEEEDYFLLIYKEHFESDGIVSTSPVCGVAEGIINYVIEWATGHAHEVEEIECRAMGHPADVFRIWKARKEE